MKQPILLGFEVGTGEPVRIPLAHTFVTGQTQLSGKTTTLRAIVGRSGCRALAFVTKRGEQFQGRRIQPYLPREGEHPIHWRLVETILAAALGQRTMKYERFWLIQAAKGATSLAGVRENVLRLLGKAKGGRTEEAYTLIREYLDLVVPEMQALAAADVLDLQPGLNVMDLAGVGAQLQALVIRAALERINHHERGVLTVFPEAWEFAPRARSAAAKDEAIAMARKGAVLGNYLLCDSQDLAGVDTVIRQAASVWILGVQRELNELKRTIDSIPAGIAKPKPADVATLGLGQFYACWGRHAVKTYVLPDWMAEAEGHSFAVHPGRVEYATPPNAPPKPAIEKEETDMSAVETKLDRLADLIERMLAGGSGSASTPPPAVSAAGATSDFEGLYQAMVQRLRSEAPALLKVLGTKPELQVQVERRVIEVDSSSLRGRIALLIRNGFLAAPTTGHKVWQELHRLGAKPAKVAVYSELKEFAKLGFLTKEGDDGYQAVDDMVINLKDGPKR